MIRVNLSYEVLVDYEQSNCEYVCETGVYKDLSKLLLETSRMNALPPNANVVSGFEYDIQDLIKLQILSNEFYQLKLIEQTGTLYMNEQFIFFENDVYVEKHKSTFGSLDLYDWLTQQIV